MSDSQNPDADVGFLTGPNLWGFLDDLPGMAYRCRWDGDWTMEFASRGSISLTGHDPKDFVENAAVSWSELIHSEDLATRTVNRHFTSTTSSDFAAHALEQA